MEVSIVIVNYNGKNLLETSLDSISKIPSIGNNKHVKKNYEVIVVDNNSSDGSVEFIKKKIIKKLKL